MPAFDPRGGSLVFLISQPRAGSTLLQRILAAHPEVETSAEPWVMLHPLYALKESGFSAEYDAETARTALADFLEPHGGREAHVAAVRAYAAELYGRALARRGRRLFLDKTPRYYNVVPELARVFPAARFVVLLRNPLAVLSSVIATWARPDESLWRHRADLMDAPRRIVDGLAVLGPAAVVVRYEELVTRPSSAVEALCRELGLAFDPSLLEYGAFPPPPGRLGDPSVESRRRPSAEGLDRWRRLGESPDTRRLALSYLHELGPELVAALGYSFEELRKALVPAAEAAPAAPHPALAPPSLPVPQWWPGSRRGAAHMPHGEEWPRISVVTPSLDQAPFLEDTLRSIASQAYPNLEHIVIDGGSTDGSVEILKRHERGLSHWVSEPDRGQYDALNKGFARSTGGIMGWLNSDDLHFPWTLDTVARIFTDCPEVAWLTTTSLIEWDADGRILANTSPGYARSWFYRGRHLLGHPDHCGFVLQEGTFWRRSLWEKAGGRVDDRLTYAGDFELWARFFEHADLVTTSCPLAGFRRHAGQKTQRMDAYVQEAAAVLDRYRDRAIQDPRLVKLASAFVRWTGRGGRWLGSRRQWLQYDVGKARWISGWEIVV